MVQLLENVGLVERARDPGDARSSIISITEQGKHVAIIAEKAILEWVAIVSDTVSQEDIETTSRTLTRFYENAIAGLA